MELVQLVALVVFVCVVLGLVTTYYFETFDQKTEISKVIKQTENKKERIEKFKQAETTSAPKVFKGPQGIQTIDNNLELYELYSKGVPDSFDINGNHIPGVEPSAEKAIFYIQKLIESPKGTKKDVLKLAKIYHQGMHRFEPDLDRAEVIYNSLVNDKTIDEDTWQQVTEGLADIQTIRTYKWLNLPLPGTEDEPVFGGGLEAEETGDAIIDNEAFNINRIIEAQEALEAQRNRERMDRLLDGIHEPNTAVGTKRYNDMQNTHDPQVLSTIRASLNRIKESPQHRDANTSFRELKIYIGGLPDSAKKQAAIKSIVDMEANKNILSTTAMTEGDVLALVWNRIHDPSKFSQEVTENLRETMFEELSSMQEHGQSVCAVGRTDRIVDTLNGVDEDVSIKPTYAVNEEMMNKSAKIRDDLVAAQPESERDHLEAGTSPRQEEFDQELKDVIIKTLKEDYVDTKILSQSKFNTEIKKWIDFI